ncbi:entry exclusion lipoprotein TrbK [Duganella sp. FT94W]|uniref:Entry exclusion lipoprotein TrbK n=1 Tax=Duganella lactea TaxID=2692173 RepID=A0ABW9V6I2_9BURK|nr:entry exclusion lipoprotein TrbK [Duganella lactea]MYM34350.1 entry exclusion lipoprotein TrbK [Duganella lactea]
MPRKLNWLLMGCAAAALAVTAYQQLGGKPQPHVVNDAGCTPEAIKRINNITERAIQSSRCAQRRQ